MAWPVQTDGIVPAILPSQECASPGRQCRDPARMMSTAPMTTFPRRPTACCTRLFRSLSAIAILCSVSGCGESTLRTFGLVHDAPDEFKVTTRAPLDIPPTLDGPLQPPRPGAPRPQEQNEQISAEAALSPSAALADPGNMARSGQKALLSAAGPSRQPQPMQAEPLPGQTKKSGLMDKLMFWQDDTVPTTLNAAEEAARLRQKGITVPPPPTTASPQAPQKKSSFLGIF
ncbi:putative membrane associated protein [Granulibacter bethesdensis]|nr:putative membrane associated protein [Granulibacter bethesdensis]